MSHVVAIEYEKKRRRLLKEVKKVEKSAPGHQQQEEEGEKPQRKRRKVCKCRETFFDTINTMCQSFRVAALLQQQKATASIRPASSRQQQQQQCRSCCVLQATSFADVHQLVKDIFVILQQERANQGKTTYAIVSLFLGEGLLNFVGHVPPAPSALDLDIIQRVSLGATLGPRQRGAYYDYISLMWRAYDCGYNFRLARFFHCQRTGKRQHGNSDLLHSVPLLQCVASKRFLWNRHEAEVVLMGLSSENVLKMEDCRKFHLEWITYLLQGKKTFKIKFDGKSRSVRLRDLHFGPRDSGMSSLQYVSKNLHLLVDDYGRENRTLQKQFACALLDITRRDRGSPLFRLPTELVDMIKDRI